MFVFGLIVGALGGVALGAAFSEDFQKLWVKIKEGVKKLFAKKES